MIWMLFIMISWELKNEVLNVNPAYFREKELNINIKGKQFIPFSNEKPVRELGGSVISDSQVFGLGAFAG